MIRKIKVQINVMYEFNMETDEDASWTDVDQEVHEVIMAKLKREGYKDLEDNSINLIAVQPPLEYT